MPNTDKDIEAILDSQLPANTVQEITIQAVKDYKKNFQSSIQDRFLNEVKQNLPRVFKVCETCRYYDILIDSSCPTFDKFKETCDEAASFLMRNGFEVSFENQGFEYRLRISGW